MYSRAGRLPSSMKNANLPHVPQLDHLRLLAALLVLLFHVFHVYVGHWRRIRIIPS
jgi:peptidoglycan/LPS O-acetylase OafA/YrhL